MAVKTKNRQVETQRARLQRQTREANEQLVISGMRQHELTEACGKLNAQLRAEITRREKIEHTLAEQARLLDLTNDAILVCDMEGRIAYWNGGAEKLYGWPREEALGKMSHTLLRTESAIPLEQVTRDLVRDNRWTGEFVQTKRDSQRITVLVRKSLDRDSEGNPRAALETFTDITGRKRMEEELQQAQTLLVDRAAQLEHLVAERTAKLEETVGELEGFSYSITHDLRAPLRAMQGFSHMLQESCGDKLDLRGKDLLRRIRDSADRMDKLIRDVLTYSNVLRVDLQLERVDLTRLLKGILESYPEFQEPRAEVRVEGELPAVLGNEAALTQCFSNLLHNATKFVAPGTKPRVRIRAEAAGGRVVRLWFVDGGIGIPKQYLSKIFEMFQRLDPSFEGTGIGLTIVRKAVERMGGQVGVESEPGRGSRFWLELKLAGKARGS